MKNIRAIFVTIILTSVFAGHAYGLSVTEELKPDLIDNTDRAITERATTSTDRSFFQRPFSREKKETTTYFVELQESAPRILDLNAGEIDRLNTNPSPSDTFRPTNIFRYIEPNNFPLSESNKPTRLAPVGTHDRIQEVGTSFRKLEDEVKRVESEVRATVIRDIDKVIEKASREEVKSNDAPPQPVDNLERQKRVEVKSNDAPPQPVDNLERQKRVEILKREVGEREEKLSKNVRARITSGDTEPPNFELELRSSLDEIESVIEAKTKVDVDLSPSVQAVSLVVAENAEELDTARTKFLFRGGLELYKDSDRDGVSDYDEKNVYRTDPENAFSAGGSITDGERILFGLNVHSTTTERVSVESPKALKRVVEGVFEVNSIAIKPKSIDEGDNATTSLPAVQKTITFSGRALPNMFVTLYIFSTPVVVTVKTDVSGAWTYTLDTELEDGAHELYIATVDAGGRIIAQSPVVPFLKTAEAAEFTPLLAQGTDGGNALDNLERDLFLLGALILLMVIAGGLYMFGRGNASIDTPKNEGV